jgi:hypothetical protein
VSTLNPFAGLLAVGLIGLSGAVQAAEIINPFPRALIRREMPVRWDFEAGAEGWADPHNCTVEAADGKLKIQCKGEDPYLFGPAIQAKAPATVTLRMRAENGGNGAIYWRTAKSPNFGEDKVAAVPLQHDGEWHEYEVHLDASGTITQVRLDPGNAAGTAEVDWMELTHATFHPLEIAQVEVEGRTVVAHVTNHGEEPLAFTLNGQPVEAAAGESKAVKLHAPGKRPIEAFTITARAEGLPPVTRTSFLHHPGIQGEWATLKSDGLTVQVALDGSGARLERGGETVAVLCPLAHAGGKLPGLRIIEDAETVRLRGEGLEVTVGLDGDEVSVAIESDSEVEGPVLRAIGGLEQGVFAGLEYLGKGERSSSTKDIETPEHVRYAPDPLKVTMPLMAACTDRAAAAMTWDDMSLQPVYAVPNFFDGTTDHRMALRGKRIRATVLVREPQPMAEVILWAVARRGLPALPEPPRTRDEQWRLCMKAINGPVKCDGGWRHCAGDRWPCQPYAAFASTLWRMTGDAPRLETLSGGGSHVRNDAIFFLHSRVAEWLDMRRGQARGAMKGQKPDGSWRYEGTYARTHFEDTASGVCARPATTLLDYAWHTGDEEALAAGIKALDYMKRFRTPRGAQTWECPLHTPDILASAYLVWAYTRGYELTGREDFRAEARRWALSGLPFVYQWTCKPVMLYATTPVFGATNWRAPNWIGLPVQWCGGVYAYALGLLAPYEKTLDWAKLARGILISAEQQQYPDGRFVGCLPDSFHLASQSRRPWNINPCAIVSLRLLLDGQVDSLAVAANDRHRVAAPFPVELRGGQAHVQGKKGTTYQILVDGERIIDVQSKGADVIPLD